MAKDLGDGLGAAVGRVLRKPVEKAGEKLKATASDVIDEKVKEAGGPGAIAKEALKSLIPGFGGGKTEGEGVGKGRRMPVQHSRRARVADRKGRARRAPRQARHAGRPAPLQGLHHDERGRVRRVARDDRGRRGQALVLQPRPRGETQPHELGPGQGGQLVQRAAPVVVRRAPPVLLEPCAELRRLQRRRSVLAFARESSQERVAVLMASLVHAFSECAATKAPPPAHRRRARRADDRIEAQFEDEDASDEAPEDFDTEESENDADQEPQGRRGTRRR